MLFDKSFFYCDVSVHNSWAIEAHRLIHVQSVFGIPMVVGPNHLLICSPELPFVLDAMLPGVFVANMRFGNDEDNNNVHTYTQAEKYRCVSTLTHNFAPSPMGSSSLKRCFTVISPKWTRLS